MRDGAEPEEIDIESAVNQQRARRGILAIALGFYLLLFVMCAVVLVIAFALRR